MREVLGLALGVEEEDREEMGCGLVRPPRDAAGWQCLAQPYRQARHLAVSPSPSLSSLSGRLGWGNKGNNGGCSWGFRQAEQPKGSRVGGELDDEIEERGEMGHVVRDGVVSSQWMRFEETTH